MPRHPEYLFVLLLGCFLYFLLVYSVFNTTTFGLNAVMACIGTLIGCVPVFFMGSPSLKFTYVVGLIVGFFRVLQYEEFCRKRLMKNIALETGNLQKINDLEMNVGYARLMAISVIIVTIISASLE